MAVTWSQVLALRMERQQLVERAGPRRPASVVGSMLGLQAQVMSSAELQAAARIDGLRPEAVRDSLCKRRRLVKVWAYRQTLHLLTPDDLSEFVVAARSLERWHSASWLRWYKLREPDVAAIIAATLIATGVVRDARNRQSGHDPGPPTTRVGQ